MRVLQFTVLTLVTLFSAAASTHASGDFRTFLAGVRQEAAQKGISQETINAALANTQHIDRVIELDRRQPESRLTFSQYKKNVITQARIDEGRALLREHRELLNRISAQYGVPPETIVALWGMETSYGKNTGGFKVVDALATLAYDGRRSSFFRGELFNALQIIDQGHITADNMKGSWAGAMGQNQFMPSSFKAYAVDGNGDGRRDIWSSLPDVFASTANYLGKSGWRNNERWGREVLLTQNIPASLRGLDHKKPLSEWARLGVKLPGGAALPVAEGLQASLVIPEGGDGKAYLVYNNYRVIMKWNRSIYFATSVGLLSDLIAKGPQ